MRWAATIIFTVVAVVALCMNYVHIEHPAYIWDYAAYWETFKRYSLWLSKSPLDAIISIIREIRKVDYNPTPILALFPFYLLFGDGRAAYIIGIAITYVLPASVVVMFLTVRVSNVRPTISLFIICATAPAFWAASLRGQPDIVGLIFLGTATIFLFKSKYLSHRPLLYGIIIGVCTYAPFMFRRWYAYSIVSFFGISALFILLRSVKSGRFKETIVPPVCGISIAGLTALTLLCLIQFDLAKRIINTTYSELYNAYQVDLYTHIMLLTEYSYNIAIFITIIGIIISLHRKNINAIFCVVSAFCTFTLFIQTQYMGRHHILPVYMWMIPSYIIGTIWICEKLGIKLFYASAINAVILIISINPVSGNLGYVAGWLIPSADMRPLHLDNFDEYKELVSKLDKLTHDDKTMVVYASSVNLSDSLLVPLNPNLKRSIIWAPHIAAVQGFPLELFDADYAVVATPDQFHMRPGSQENILLPGRWILDGTGFGQAYERIAEFKLQNGVTAFIYERNRSVKLEEKLELLDKLTNIYPDNPDLFTWPAAK